MKIKTPLKQVKTKDSTSYFRNKEYISNLKALTSYNKPAMDFYFKESDDAKKDLQRQSKKGKPGYDKNGFKIKPPLNQYKQKK